MIDDWVNKRHTNLNMFSVVGEQIRSLSSKQSKFNFWNQLQPTIAFLYRFRTQTATCRPSHTILTSNIKHQTSKFRGGQNFLSTVGGFFQQERVLCSWLAGSSHTHVNIWKGKKKITLLHEKSILADNFFFKNPGMKMLAIRRVNLELFLLICFWDLLLDFFHKEFF